LNLTTTNLRALFFKRSLAPDQEQVDLLKGATRDDYKRGLQLNLVFTTKFMIATSKTYNGFESMICRTKDGYLTKHMNMHCLGGPVDVKDAVKTDEPFEVNKCAAAEIKAVLQNGSEETIKRVVNEEIAKIDKK
jgi:hypothetical protein